MKFPIHTCLTLSLAVGSIVFSVPSQAETKAELGNPANALVNSTSLQSVDASASQLPLNNQFSFDSNQQLTVSNTVEQPSKANTSISEQSEQSETSEVRNTIPSRIFPCPSMAQ